MARNVNIKFKMQVANMNQDGKDLVNTLLPKKIHFSKHAIEQMKARKIYTTKENVLANLIVNHVIDLQVDSQDNVKFLVRYPHTKTNDIVLVVTLTGVICTVWVNNKNDTHKTLKDKHLYTNDMNKLYQII